MPSHPCTFALAGPPARHVLPFPFLPIQTLLLFQLQLQPSSPPSPPSPAAHSVLCLLGSRRTLIVGTTVQGLVTCCLVIWLALWGFWSQSDCSFHDSDIHVQGAASLGALGREVTATLWFMSRAREVLLCPQLSNRLWESP